MRVARRDRERHPRSTTLLLGLAAVCLLHAAPRPILAQPADPDRAQVVASNLGAGINILSSDPFWSRAGTPRFKLVDFRRIRDRGFRTVRINLQAFAHMDASLALEPDWLGKLDQVIDAALAADLNVILDEHDFYSCGLDPEMCRTKLTAFWRQIGSRNSQRPDRVLFEVLNEPNKGLNAEVWNGLLVDLIALIRETNPSRMIVVGPADWNSFTELDRLILPENDRNLIVTIHYYAPHAFTHQGAPWMDARISGLSGVTWGTPQERAQVDTDFTAAQAWATRQNRPLLLGEFGAYETGDLASRVAYTATVARAAERQGWSWIYWQFDDDFRAFDTQADTWIEPIVGALLPRSER
jgi:endoglucanase